MPRYSKMFVLIVNLACFNLLYSQCDDGFSNINDECYYQNDLDVLEYIIYNSDGSINLILDDNNDGFISSLELCNQQWFDGRLTSIDCGPIIINGTYNWLNISSEIPDIITNWTNIDRVIFAYNDFSGLVPESICDLGLDFSDESVFNFQGNNLCPAYPECIEDYVGSQSNWGTGSCELGNCYDVQLNNFIIYEDNGDNLINSNELDDGISKMLIGIYNDGPDCSNYPGIHLSCDTPGINIGSEYFYWYGIWSGGQYYADLILEISPFVPIGTQFSITAQSITMNCLDETCIEDPYCHDCPLSNPITITLVVGQEFPNQMGDLNIDGEIDVLDIIILVSYILENNTDNYQFFNSLSNFNDDDTINILDVIYTINMILNNNLG